MILGRISIFGYNAIELNDNLGVGLNEGKEVISFQILNFSNEDRLKSMVKQIFEENNYTMHALKMNKNKKDLKVVYRGS